MDKTGRGPERYYDIDWVRVIGVLSVFTFHTTMYFNTWDWHAKNKVTTTAIQPLGLTFLVWIMPLMFVVSGLSTHYSLGRRTPGAFLKERFARLGVPLLLGIFILSPFQVYSERVTYGKFAGTFWNWVPRYFQGWYSVTPDGNFAWMGLHLWYLLVLLVTSIVAVSVGGKPRADGRPGTLGRLFQASGPLGVVLVPPLFIIVTEGLLFAAGLDKSQAWWPLLVYPALFALGNSLAPDDLLRATARKAGPAILLGVLATTVPLVFAQEPRGFSALYVAYHLLKVYCSWFWILGLFYLAGRYLSRNSPALQYCNEAVMPFYVLHQPVIVGLGFTVRDLSLPVALKWPLLWVVSLAIIMTIYHFIVRPFDPVRFLFGMKPRRQSQGETGTKVSPAAAQVPGAR